MGDAAAKVPSVSTLLEDISEEENDIRKFQRSITAKKQLIRGHKQTLWTTCEHEWVRDYFVSFDDKCKYYCRICNLWKDKAYYFN